MTKLVDNYITISQKLNVKCHMGQPFSKKYKPNIIQQGSQHQISKDYKL